MNENIQPHEAVQASKGFVSNLTLGERTQRITCFLSVYEVTRHFGGREEGGWWYDVYNFTGAAFPFHAEQDYEAQSVEGLNEVECGEWIDEETKAHMMWVPVGNPRVLDEPTRVRVASARAHLISVYGSPNTGHRYSCAPRGDDYAFVYELEPGERSARPTPRYE